MFAFLRDKKKMLLNGTIVKTCQFELWEHCRELSKQKKTTETDTTYFYETEVSTLRETSTFEHSI